MKKRPAVKFELTWGSTWGPKPKLPPSTLWGRLVLWWAIRRVRRQTNRAIAVLLAARRGRESNPPSLFDRWGPLYLRYYLLYMFWVLLSTTNELAYRTPPPSLPPIVKAR